MDTTMARPVASLRPRRRGTSGARKAKFDPPHTTTKGSWASETVEQVVPSSAWFGPFLEGSQERELVAFLGSHNGVAVLQWPRDAEHLPRLMVVGIPRLLLVHPSSQAPPPDGALQLAIGHSSDQDEIHRSLVLLCREAALRRSASGPPVLDEENRLRAGDGAVELPPVAQRLARVLVEHFDQPVDDEHLLALEVTGFSMSASSLEGHLARLCQLVNPLGLEVVSKPGHTHSLRWCAA